MALRWKKDEPPRGLMMVTAGPRGSKLRDGDHVFATVNALRRDYSVVGWYWTARGEEFGVPYINTCSAPCQDEATAKAQAMAYVKKHLATKNPATTGDRNGE